MVKKLLGFLWRTFLIFHQFLKKWFFLSKNGKNGRTNHRVHNQLQTWRRIEYFKPFWPSTLDFAVKSKKIRFEFLMVFRLCHFEPQLNPNNHRSREYLDSMSDFLARKAKISRCQVISCACLINLRLENLLFLNRFSP